MKYIIIAAMIVLPACGRNADDIEHAPVHVNIDPVIIVDTPPVIPTEDNSDIGEPIAELPPLADVVDMNPSDEESPTVVPELPTVPELPSVPELPAVPESPPAPTVTPYPNKCKGKIRAVWVRNCCKHKHDGRLTILCRLEGK